jgi:hypothetical protein
MNLLRVQFLQSPAIKSKDSPEHSVLKYHLHIHYFLWEDKFHTPLK